MSRNYTIPGLFYFLICALLLPHMAGAQDTTVGNHKELRNVTIRAQKPLIERKTDKTVMNIAGSALSEGNNALEILARAPGVSVDYNGNVSMNGKSGVNVLIDGKQTYLSGEQLAALLRSTQGSTIQSVEMITNTSARYDASGAGGIINIRLKKNLNYGTNGSITMRGGMGKYLKGNAGLTLNHRQKWYNIYGDYNYNYDKGWRDLKIDRINRQENSSDVFNGQTKVAIINKGSTYRSGIDFFLNKNNTLGLMVSGSNRNGSDQSNSNTQISSAPDQTDSTVLADNTAKRKAGNIAYNANFKSMLDSSGQELTVDLNYIRYNNTQESNYNNVFYNDAGTISGLPVVFRNDARSSIRIWAAQTDYSYSFNPKTKIDAGIKSSFVHTDNNLLFDNFTSGAWGKDTTRSNRFVYDENINAAYLNVNHTFKTTAIQVGLRAEQTNATGNSVTAQQVVDHHYPNLFPAVFLHQPITGDHEIDMSFSRKIDRPDYASLNPFVNNFDLYTLGKGNPFLNPQYTNIFELGYTYKKRLFLRAGASQTNHVITEVTLPDTLTKTLYVQNQNLATLQSCYLNISAPVKITGWWSTENNVSIFYNRFSTPDLLGQHFSNSKTSVNLNSYQAFSIHRSASIELSLLYISPRVQGTYLFAALYRADIGFKKSFLQNKATLKIGIEDLFNSHKEHVSSAIPGQDYTIYQKFDTRVFKLSFTYRFGGNSTKESGQRPRSSSAEEHRAGN